MDGLSYLPKVEKENLKIWDDKRNSCCGYLNKKAGSTSTLSKGKWQKRWFVIQLQLTAQENYNISYFHAPDDKNARQSFPLDGATIAVGAGSNVGNSFQLTCSDGNNVMLGADSKQQMQQWLQSIDYVIEIATARGAMLRDRWGASPGDSQTASIIKNTRHDQHKDMVSSLVREDGIKQANMLSPKRNTVVSNNNSNNPFHYQSAVIPTIRLDIDINTIPPGSVQRNTFEEMFINDIAKSLDIDVHLIHIHRVTPAPGMEWLILVEFDITITPESLGIRNRNNNSNEYDEESGSLDEEIYHQCKQKRKELLELLYADIQDITSALYQGFVTCSVDPSYTQTLLEELNGDNYSNQPTVLFSSSPEVLETMEKYQNVKIGDGELDISHFVIYVSFEGRVKPVLVPNPLILRKKYCVLWPFEVKTAIGMMGNMQELWIEPMALAPKGLPKHLSDPIFFEASARLGGALVIHASKLKADLTYEVMCDDRRTDILQELTDGERQSIQHTFQQYDTNGDNTVSRVELEELIRARTAERKNVIDQKFNEFVSEALSEEAYLKAEEFRRMHYQQLTEAQTKLIKMFENADINGDGTLSFTEFLLAEAWWMLCTLNPERVSLF